MQTRTNIVLDDELVERAMTKAGVTTKKAAIEAALRAYVRAPDWKGLLALAGSGALADDYDLKRLFAGDSGVHHVDAPAAAYLADRESAAGEALRVNATVRPATRPAGEASSVAPAPTLAPPSARRRK